MYRNPAGNASNLFVPISRQSGNVISNPHVFEGEYVPDRLLHRDAEQNTLARAFEPALEGERPDDILLYGPHGVGKTALVRHTMSDLQAETEADWAHVRTMGETVAGVVRETLRQLGGDPGAREPLEDVCLALRDRVTDPTVVVLDEADDLDEDVLRRLTDVPWVGVVPIVHDPESFRRDLDDHRVQHRLTGAGLELQTYAPSELADILEPRVRKGLDGSVDRSYLERIADRSSGTARKAIQTLRAAAELAGERNCPIETVDIGVAYQRALGRIREANLRSMDTDYHVLYELIREAGEIKPGDLHDRYERVKTEVYTGVTTEPIGKRRRRDKLRKLAEYELVEKAENRHQYHRVRDATIVSEHVTLPARTVPDD